MTGNLKVLGMALVAAFAMSAVVASAAQAEKAFHFYADEDHVKLTGTQHASVVDVSTFDAGTLSCTTANYHGTIQSASTLVTTMTLKPTYSNCHAAFGSNATVDTNSCGYMFHTGTYSGGKFEGNVDIECTTPGDQIVITSVGCRVTIPAQIDRTTVTFTNVNSSPQQATSTKEITVDLNITGLIYEEHNQGLFPTCATNTGGLKSNGTYAGAALILGENEAGGNHVGIYVQQTP